MTQVNLCTSRVYVQKIYVLPTHFITCFVWISEQAATLYRSLIDWVL